MSLPPLRGPAVSRAAARWRAGSPGRITTAVTGASRCGKAVGRYPGRARLGRNRQSLARPPARHSLGQRRCWRVRIAVSADTAGPASEDETDPWAITRDARRRAGPGLPGTVRQSRVSPLGARADASRGGGSRSGADSERRSVERLLPPGPSVDSVRADTVGPRPWTRPNRDHGPLPGPAAVCRIAWGEPSRPDPGFTGRTLPLIVSLAAPALPGLRRLRAASPPHRWC